MTKQELIQNYDKIFKEHFTNNYNTYDTLRDMCYSYCEKHYPDCDIAFKSVFLYAIQNHHEYNIHLNDLATSFNDIGELIETTQEDDDMEYIATIISDDPNFLQFVSDNIDLVLKNG